MYGQIMIDNSKKTRILLQTLHFDSPNFAMYISVEYGHIIFDQVGHQTMYRDFSPYANFITAVFQNFPDH